MLERDLRAGEKRPEMRDVAVPRLRLVIVPLPFLQLTQLADRKRGQFTARIFNLFQEGRVFPQDFPRIQRARE